MKKNIFPIIIAVLGLILGFNACQPDEYSLGSVISKDQLNYSITQNPDDPNMIILESLTPGLTPLWITPMGRSTKVKDTVKLAFSGNYSFIYGVLSDGGYVADDTSWVNITTVNTSYITDPLWTLLSGGVGKSKSWVLDLDADGVSRYFDGPLYFYGTDNGWEGECFGDDCWNWNPDYPGNSWLMSAGDYGLMTFNLIGNANVTVEHNMLDKTETGTYFLDADNKTLRMYDAAPLHDSGRDGVVIDWGDLKIFSLTEDYMQLAALRDDALSGEGACLLVYNYISKDYYDNWVPEEEVEPEPTLPDGWQEDVSQTVNTTIVWKLSESNPIDWANLDGSMMNGWENPEDYPDWLGTPDVSVYGGFSMTMNSADESVIFVTPDGTTTEGTYSLDEKGIYSFDITVPSFTVISWASFAADANNQLRILQIEKDASGNVTGMWLGARSSEKDEYTAYHVVPSSGSSEVDPMQAWKSALKGKTFVPDVNYFADWYDADWTGGWTAYLFPSDFEGQSWFWSEDIYNACVASSISFYMDGDVMMADAVDNGTAKTGITVDINTDSLTLTFSEAPFTYSWIFTNNNEGKGPWLFGSHDGASLSNIPDKGIYLGFYSKYDENDPEVPTEITAFHMVESE